MNRIPQDSMHLSLTISGRGFHPSAWIVAQNDNELSLAYYAKLAALAEQACLDFILFDDRSGLSVYENEVREHYDPFQLESIAIASSLVSYTKHIGLIPVTSIAHQEPYHVARKTASLDILTQGRAGWGAAIKFEEQLQQHFSAEQLRTKHEQQEQAQEFIEVVRKLWDSWEDDAIIVDKQAGVFADPQKYYKLHHKGKHFTVNGALNVKRPPQGHPLIIYSEDQLNELAFQQAGSDIVLLSNLDHSSTTVDRNQRRLLNIVPYIASSKEEAVYYKHKLDQLLPTEQETIKGLLVKQAIPLIGTAEDIANELKVLFMERKVDGFNIVPAALERDAPAFLNRVVPLLQESGVFRTCYEESSLRERFRLDKPKNYFADATK